MQMQLFHVIDYAHNQYVYLVKDYVSLYEEFERDQRDKNTSQSIYTSQLIAKLELSDKSLKGIFDEPRNYVSGKANILIRIKPEELRGSLL